ncbi:hypothetical protein HK104_004912, partial [Borealophlyctis nickersoniae]
GAADPDFVDVAVGALDEPGRVRAVCHTYGRSEVEGYKRPDGHLAVFESDV